MRSQAATAMLVQPAWRICGRAPENPPQGGSSSAKLVNAFQEFGVDGESIERPGMVALDVPPTADLAKVQRLLDHGVAEESWDMEEGCITAQWRAASAC